MDTDGGDDHHPAPAAAGVDDKDSIVKMSAADAEKRPNFSAIGTANVSIAKTPTSTAKPGDIRKLVIKNFKCKTMLENRNFACVFFFSLRAS